MNFTVKVKNYKSYQILYILNSKKVIIFGKLYEINNFIDESTIKKYFSDN